MNDRICENELEILAAVRAGGLDDAGRRHVDSCPVCAAAVAAERALSEVAAAFAAEAPPLPAASAVWLRGRLRARAEAEARALRPLALWHTLAALIAAAGLLVGLASSGGLFGSLAAAELSPTLGLLLGGLAALVALPAVSLRRTRV
jgi:hypothetical protein